MLPKSNYHVKERTTELRDMRQRTIEPLIGDTVSARDIQTARDGSRRLFIALAQYHAKHARWGDQRQYWQRKGREASFGN